MKRTIIILLDSLIFAGVLPGCGTAMTVLADMSGQELSMAGGFITIVPSIAERDLSTPVEAQDQTPAQQTAAPAQQAPPPGPGQPAQAQVFSAPAAQDKAVETSADESLSDLGTSETSGFVPLSFGEPPAPSEPSVQPAWDIPIVSSVKAPDAPVEKAVTSPFSQVDATVDELIAKLDIPKPKKITIHHPPGDTLGLVAIYAMNQREVLVVDPMDAEGRVSPEALALFEQLLRSRKTGATHDVDPALVRLLYGVALAHDRVLVVSSGYREPGGGTKPTSYHTKGMAADVRHPYLPAKSIVDFARAWGAGGIGYYPKTKFVHLDVREDPYYWVDYSASGENGQVLADWEGTLADEAAAIWEPDHEPDEVAWIDED